MKFLHTLLLPAAVTLLLGACEKQSYSETRVFTHHGEHAASADVKAASPAGAAQDQKPAKH